MRLFAQPPCLASASLLADARGQMRAFGFDAAAGDWAIHCHKSHHTMNAMGHGVPTMIGVDQGDVARKIAGLRG